MLISILGPEATQFIQNGADLEHRPPVQPKNLDSSRLAKHVTGIPSTTRYPNPVEIRVAFSSRRTQKIEKIEKLEDRG